jgi:hypothetical protein
MAYYTGFWSKMFLQTGGFQSIAGQESSNTGPNMDNDNAQETIKLRGQAVQAFVMKVMEAHVKLWVSHNSKDEKEFSSANANPSSDFEKKLMGIYQDFRSVKIYALKNGDMVYLEDQVKKLEDLQHDLIELFQGSRRPFMPGYKKQLLDTLKPIVDEAQSNIPKGSSFKNK